MIRSTRHHLKDCNAKKFEIYQNFLNEYSRVTKLMVEEIWVSLPEDLSLSKYLNYKDFKIGTNLSARALSSAITQASGIVRSAVEKQRRRIWVRENKNANVKNVKFKKPSLDFIAPNLSSKCCDIKETPNGKYWGYVRIRSVGKDYGSINIPIIRLPKLNGQYKSGVAFFKNSVQVTWEIEKKPKEQGFKIVGLDQGFKTIATLSDGQSSPEFCPHGHSSTSINEKLSRKNKGSKSFKKAQRHRKNFVNWSINQLNLSGLKELRLEKVVNIRLKKRCSRSMSHWSNPEIRDKIKRRCEELEVPVIEQSCAYRSQRCHQCGQVRKANRKAKLYECQNCGMICDADLNAAKNHEQDLPPVPWSFLGRKLNLGNGFLWNSEGFFNFDGAEIRVPCC